MLDRVELMAINLVAILYYIWQSSQLTTTLEPRRIRRDSSKLPFPQPFRRLVALPESNPRFHICDFFSLLSRQRPVRIYVTSAQEEYVAALERYLRIVCNSFDIVELDAVLLKGLDLLAILLRP